MIPEGTVLLGRSGSRSSALRVCPDRLDSLLPSAVAAWIVLDVLS